MVYFDTGVTKGSGTLGYAQEFGIPQCVARLDGDEARLFVMNIIASELVQCQCYCRIYILVFFVHKKCFMFWFLLHGHATVFLCREALFLAG